MAREPRSDRADRARRRAPGDSARWAAAFVGLNPVLLVLAVGGAHNDTLVLLRRSRFALLLSAGASAALARPRRSRSPRASAVKLTAGLVLPFLVLAPPRRRERVQRRSRGAVGLLAVAASG